MNDKDIQTLKALAEKATPGPWFTHWTGVYSGTPKTKNAGELSGYDKTICEMEDIDLGQRKVKANAKFIAAANPQAILSLIASHEQQAARIAELEALLAAPARDVGGLTDERIAELFMPLMPELPAKYALRKFARAIEREVLATKEAEPVQAEVRNAALEEAANICDAIAQNHRDQYKGRGKHAPNNQRRADPHADGCADGAWECEEAIRALATSPAPSVKQEANRDVTQLANWLLVDPEDGSALTFAGPLEKWGVGLSQVKMMSKNGNVWTLVAGLREGYKTEAERNANLLRIVNEELAAPSASQEGVPQRVLRIKVDYKPTFSERGWLEVFAQEFTIEGSEGQRFAVHNSVSRIGEYTATHVETGFAIGHGETPEEAVERARERWMTCPPEELALKIIRAKNNTAIAGKRAMLSAAPAPSVTDGGEHA